MLRNLLAERRKVLKILIMGALSPFIYPLWEFVSSSRTGEGKSLVIKREQIEGSHLPRLFEDVWVSKTEDGKIVAFRNRCTHLGCPLFKRDGYLQCKCHGSRFSFLGERLKGPARRNLEPVRVQVLKDGSLRIEIPA